MKCKIEGCDRESMYAKKQLCQKHYFRFMRNGTYDLVRKRNYRSRNCAGYQLLYEPLHPLAQSNGYVYEHRMVYHDEINHSPSSCELCGEEINWASLHIDHKDNDVTNNSAENLRATCRPCNTFRGYTQTSMTDRLITIGDKTLPIHGLSKHPDATVTAAGITRRLDRGMSNYDAVFSAKKLNGYK